MSLLNGILIVNKSPDWTSHDVVAKLRGILGIKRIGHGGTLDPMATGVLPVFIGYATRVVEFCEKFEKEYIADILFGIATDTQDITGNVLRTSNTENITADDIRDVLPRFLYEQKQIPPMYSAIKVEGKKLYELARKGIEIERSARDIYIDDLELLDDSVIRPNDSVYGSYRTHEKVNKLCGRVRVVCSKGTYIRTLCVDIGKALGSEAVMSGLIRTRVGKYKLENSYSLDGICDAVKNGKINELILPVDSIFEKYPIIKLNESDTKKCKNGVACDIADPENGKYRVYSNVGEFLTFSELKNGKLKTIKSFYLPMLAGEKQ